MHIKDKPVAKIFPELIKLVEQGKCPMCGNIITEFKDELSLKEYKISGLCQTCQDEVF